MQNLDSVFDVGGKREGGVAKAFGVILRNDKTVLKKFLLSVFKNVNARDFKECTISFEEFHGKHGRTDIEIKNSHCHVIVECKVKRGKVGKNQKDKYLRILRKSKSKKKGFVTLTQSDPNISKETESGNIIFSYITWERTLELVKKRDIHISLAKEYEKYLMGGHRMKIYDIDIWAVSISRSQQIRNYERKDFYINKNKHKPIFLGRRTWDTNLKKSVIKELRPVLLVYDRDSKEGRRNGRNYIYQLGQKLVLQNPIIRKKPFSQSSAIAVDFSELKII